MENSLDLIENGMKEIVEAAENDNHMIQCDKEILVESSDNKVTLGNGSAHEATENDKEIENNAKGDEGDEGLGGGGEDIGDKYVEDETTQNTQEITSATNGTNKETDKTDLASDDGEVFPSMVVHQIVSRETSVEPEPAEFTTSMASHHISQSADLQENQDLHQDEEIATIASNISKEINDLVEKDVEISDKDEIIVEKEVESVVNGETEEKIEDIVIEQDDTQEKEEKDSEIPQPELLNSNEEVTEISENTEPEAPIQIESNHAVEINVTTSEEEVRDETDSNNSESFPSMLSHQIALEPKSVDSTITMTTHQIASREASMEPKFLDSGTSMATHRISTCYDEDFSVTGETVIEDTSDLAKETAIDPDMPHLESFSSMVVHQIASREASMEPKVIDSTTSMSAHQVGSMETSMEPKLMDSGTSMAYRISAAFDDNTKLIEDKAENVESLEPDVVEEIINAPECKEESRNECQNRPSEEDNETNEITKNTLQKQESDEDTISGEEIPIIASCTFGNNSAIVQDIKMENQAADNIKEVKHHINDEPSIIIDDVDEECIEEGEAITASCTFGNNKPIVIETKIPEVNTIGAEEDKESRDNYDKVSSEIITEIVNQRFSRNISNGDAVKEPEKIDKIEPSPKVEKKVEIDLPKVEVIAKEPTPLPESKPPKKSILETLFGCFGCFKGQQS